jgi:hypothetical protein
MSHRGLGQAIFDWAAVASLIMIVGTAMMLFVRAT